jgi:hypothetical protein
MPSIDGTSLDPGREREREKKRDEGAIVMSKILEETGAPSRPSLSTVVIVFAMTEFTGRARPRMPSNSCSSASVTTFVAAAVMEKHTSTKYGRVRAQMFSPRA